MQGVGLEGIQRSHFSKWRALASDVCHRAVAAALIGLMTALPVRAQQLPTGGSVAAGSATIGTPSNGTLNINQSTNQAIINWNSFSVGRGGTVNFNQPNSSSATLNRVLGSTPSWIAGTINAPGTVLLVNPNGIAITKSGVINTGSFAASTLDISNADFMAGNYRFTGNGGSAGVRNAGRINVSDGGFAALLGGQVSNSGIISARLGKVGLGAGELITLDFAGDGFLSVAVPSSQIGKLVNASGALVTNSGKIRANGGQVFLSTATASNILRDAVNVPGSIRANSVGTRGGKIVIGGGAGGKVNVTGRLAAKGGKKNAGGSVAVTGASVNLAGKVNVSGKTGGAVVAQADQSLSITGKIEAKGRDGKGGEISITSADISLVGAKLDASGTTGGGTILIGGGYQGTGSLAHALNVVIDANSVIRADALDRGNGGTSVVWSDGQTNVAGTFSAQGGVNGGNGGYVETSGKHLHVADTTQISTLAKNGKTGTWLIDPNDFTIAAVGGDISGATLSAQLATNDVVILSSDGGTAGNGDIFVNDTVSWSSAHSLTLNAERNINVRDTITLGDGALSLIATSAIAINAPINVTGAGTVALAAANDNATVPGASLLELSFARGASVSFAETAPGSGVGIAGQALTINGDSYNLIYSLAGIQALDNTVGRHDALALSLTATGNYGGYLVNLYRGTFEGLGNTIADLKINSSSGASVFNSLGTNGTDGTLRNLGIIGASAFTNTSGYTGSFVGQNSGIIANVFSSASLNNTSYVGGIVGANFTGGTIVNSYFTGAVSSAGGYAGGIAGSSDATSTISRSFSTGAVFTTGYGGGLVGINSGTIANSFATGRVTASLGNGGGGLAGLSEDPTSVIVNSYWDTQTTGRSNSDRSSTVSAATYGLTTTDFQSGFAGSLGSAYAGGTNGFYPYLKTFFPNGVQAISGTAYTDAGVTPAASGAGGAVPVTGFVNGAVLGSATTGANGYYYVFGAPTSGNQVVVSSSGATGGATFQENATFQPSGSNSQLAGLNIFGTYLKQQTTANTLSQVSTDFATALGANSLPTYTNRQIDITAGSFAIDQALTVTGTLVLVSGGFSVTQSSGVTAAALTLDVFGSVNLGSLSNSIGSVSGTAQSLFMWDTANLTIGAAGLSATSGNVSILGDGSITVLGAVSADDRVDLEAHSTLSGSGAITAVDKIIFSSGSGSVLLTGVITGSRVEASSGLNVSLTNANNVFNRFGSNPFGGSSVFIGGNVTVVHKGALTVDGLESLAGSTLSFTTNSGGSITVGDVVRFGTMTLNSAGALTVNGRIDAGTTPGFFRTVNLIAQGPITQANTGAGINAVALRADTSSGGIALAPTGNGANDVNTIGTFAASAGSGDIAFKAAAGFNIGTVGPTNGITASGAGAAVSLQTTSGAITQSQAIAADTLLLSTANGNVTLNGATNAITNLGTVTLGSGSLNLLDAGGLTVTGAVGATGGITLNTSGALAINAALNAGTGNVSLTTTGAGNAISQNASGIITANTLTLATNNGDAALGSATSAITNLGTATLGSGALNLLDAGGLTVTGAVGATGGVTLSAGGAIALNANVNVGTGTLSFITSGVSGSSRTAARLPPRR